MEIKASDVKALRDKTGAGMMECKKALVDSNGDPAAAEKLLKEKGLAAVAKRAERAVFEFWQHNRFLGQVRAAHVRVHIKEKIVFLRADFHIARQVQAVNHFTALRQAFVYRVPVARFH